MPHETSHHAHETSHHAPDAIRMLTLQTDGTLDAATVDTRIGSFTRVASRERDEQSGAVWLSLSASPPLGLAVSCCTLVSRVCSDQRGPWTVRTVVAGRSYFRSVGLGAQARLKLARPRSELALSLGPSRLLSHI